MKCPDCLTECAESVLFCSVCGFKFSPQYKMLLQKNEELEEENKNLNALLQRFDGLSYMTIEQKQETLCKSIKESQIVINNLQEEIEELLLMRNDLIKDIDFTQLKGHNQKQCEMSVLEKLYPSWKVGKITARQFAQELGLKLNTFYRAIQDYELSCRTFLGRAKKAAQGGYSGGRPPYGYKPVKGRLVIDEDEATLVREIFALRNGGATFDAIASKLNKKDMKTRGGKPWGICTIRFMIDNEKFYRGLYKYGKDSEWVEGQHPAIL